MSANVNPDANSRRRNIAGTDASPTAPVDPTVDEITYPALTGARTLFLPNPAIPGSKVQRGWKLKIMLGTGPTAGSTLTLSCPAQTVNGVVYAAKNINGAATLVLATNYQSATLIWNPEMGQFQATVG